MLLFVILWIPCGVLAYGLAKGGQKGLLESLGDYAGYGINNEFFNWLSGALGIFGFVVVLPVVLSASENDKIPVTLCFRMPEKLKER